MKRKCIEYGLDKFKRQFPELANSTVRVFYDVEDIKQCKELIHDIISPFNEKFKRILSVVLKGDYQDNLYKIEDTNVTAMKFLGKNCNNARIYCKEILKNGKKVVMISPYFKKVEKNQDDPSILKIIADIKTYEYEI